MARLILESAEDRGREYRIAGAIVIGRLKTNPVPIDDAKASREHAAVRLVGAEYMLADLDSRNGTMLNGEMVRGQARLRSGDRIAIGATEFRFVEDPEDQVRRSELAAKAAAPPPPIAATPPAPPKPEPPRVAPVTATRPEVARLKGPGPFERFLSIVIHTLLFILSSFVSWKVAGLVIDRLMK
jgi:hypothetical protein